jgi:hypothetical protein
MHIKHNARKNKCTKTNQIRDADLSITVQNISVSEIVNAHLFAEFLRESSTARNVENYNANHCQKQCLQYKLTDNEALIYLLIVNIEPHSGIVIIIEDVGKEIQTLFSA